MYGEALARYAGNIRQQHTAFRLKGSSESALSGGLREISQFSPVSIQFVVIILL
jgi:hypothetical protein